MVTRMLNIVYGEGVSKDLRYPIKLESSVCVIASQRNEYVPNELPLLWGRLDH